MQVPHTGSCMPVVALTSRNTQTHRKPPDPGTVRICTDIRCSMPAAACGRNRPHSRTCPDRTPVQPVCLRILPAGSVAATAPESRYSGVDF